MENLQASSLKKKLRYCIVLLSLMCWYVLQREAELVLLFSQCPQSSKLCHALSSWGGANICRGTFPILDETADHFFMDSSPSIWLWFWRGRSLGFVGLSRAGHGQLWRLIFVMCEGPQSSYLMCLGVAAFKAHAGFWGVGQDLKSQALKCSVVWFRPVVYFVDVVLVRVGFFCDSFWELDSWFYSLWLSIPKQLSLLLTCFAIEFTYSSLLLREISVPRYLWKHVKICYFWISVIIAGKWMQ